jgi:Arc/MetJ-type ribon-helix-helix transcriptional regulator
MSQFFSPHIEHLIQTALASGLFPSREAVLEAGVERLLGEEPAQVPAEHVQQILEGLDELDAGEFDEMTADEWEELRQLARDVAAGKKPQIN